MGTLQTGRWIAGVMGSPLLSHLQLLESGGVSVVGAACCSWVSPARDGRLASSATAGLWSVYQRSLAAGSWMALVMGVMLVGSWLWSADGWSAMELADEEEAMGVLARSSGWMEACCYWKTKMGRAIWGRWSSLDRMGCLARAEGRTAMVMVEADDCSWVARWVSTHLDLGVAAGQGRIAWILAIDVGRRAAGSGYSADGRRGWEGAAMTGSAVDGGRKWGRWGLPA
ncbi:hypothetical protein ACLOJK_022432 [Asimina triloba]